MASKIYVASETTKTFKDSGGDVTFMAADVANAAGRLSAQLDLGSASRSRKYKVKFVTKFVTAAPTIGKVVRLHLVEGDGTGAEDIAGNEPGTTEGALASEDSFRNWPVVCTVVVQAASTTTQMVAFDVFETSARYMQLALWNDSGGTVDANDGAAATYVVITPVPDESQ